MTPGDKAFIETVMQPLYEDEARERRAMMDAILMENWMNQPQVLAYVIDQVKRRVLSRMKDQE